MKATIYPSSLSGTIPAIASKSQAHRLLICAALSREETVISCATLSADITATADCLRALGTDIVYDNGFFTVRPMDNRPATVLIDCGESGSTLRFLLPVICALGTEARIVMHGRLPDRPLSPLWEELEAHGAFLSRPTANTISVSGSISGGTYTLAADVSSQFVSGLLFALPLTEQDSFIQLIGQRESVSYLDMTCRTQALFNVTSRFENNSYLLSGGQHYSSPHTVSVEGDWSNGAFWVAADRILGGTLNITGLDPTSSQGDKAVEKISLRIAAGSAVVDCRDIPDLVPVLAVLAAVSPGETRFINAGRLRIKESDRLKTTASLLSSLGACVQELPDGLIVTGVTRLAGGEVDSANDHRIAMSAAVAALACREPVVLHRAQAVNKSYPAFWEDYQQLGGRVILEDEP